MKQKASALVVAVLLAVCFQAVRSNPLRNENEKIEVIESCSSPIYCQGQLLDVVQTAKIFNDSKTFVDMSLLNSADVTLESFGALMNDTNGNPTRKQITDFVDSNFISQNETVSWTPTDFTSHPNILEQINDEKVRQFAANLINIWPNLGRQISSDVRENPEKHSILNVPNGFIVPGGRFRELYYWDSYWIIKGLLISEMYETVRGMLENICHLVNQYGFMPNGARLYYLNRSQPPILTLMIQEYLKYTQDTTWVKNNVQCVETEMTFWLENRFETVEKDGVSVRLAHYGPKSNTPRPESYEKDVKTCSFFSDEKAKRQCYRSLKSGAETGWDFSSRWFFDSNGGTDTNLTNIRAERVVPVDLNTFLCRAFSDLADFYGLLEDPAKQVKWQENSDLLKQYIEFVFYNEDDGIWYDYDPILKQSRKYFYPSNFAPLWAEVYDTNIRDQYGRKAAEYFQKLGLEKFIGGIPTSLEQSGEQWDFRNAWPPLQEFVVLGLLKTGNSEAMQIANITGQRWISANMIGYDQNKVMFEKYDALDPGKNGGGGEYTVQDGFGWTNGVALSFIDTFYTNK